VTWDEGLTAIAAVEMDRSLAILPFHAVDAVLANAPAALASTFARLETGERPPGLTRGAYAVLLP
ncbi:MAG: hypothetical protein KC656_35970, partial [Myxococcales bacterium]|nr:hypothetical protein [Myxococcales bacterium]